MVAGYSVSTIYVDSISRIGAVAQLGERMTGSHEVRGSIPLGSTNDFNILGLPHTFFVLCFISRSDAFHSFSDVSSPDRSSSCTNSEIIH